MPSNTHSSPFEKGHVHEGCAGANPSTLPPAWSSPASASSSPLSRLHTQPTLWLLPWTSIPNRTLVKVHTVQLQVLLKNLLHFSRPHCVARDVVLLAVGCSVLRCFDIVDPRNLQIHTFPTKSRPAIKVNHLARLLVRFSASACPKAVPHLPRSLITTQA